MKIAIDLNDVVREFSYNFLKHYCEYNREFNPDDTEFWTNDMQAIFPFKNDRAYNKFVYEDYTFELFGKCETTTRTLTSDLAVWCDEINNIETEDKGVEAMFVSTREGGESIGYTLFFISKLGPKIREIYFPTDPSKIWDGCDALITADPILIKNKPEGKRVIKIITDYNKEMVADYEYKDFSSFLRDINNTIKLTKNGTFYEG